MNAPESLFTPAAAHAPDAARFAELLAQSRQPFPASSKSYLHGAIAAGQHWRLGQGHGPLAHFWRTVRD